MKTTILLTGATGFLGQKWLKSSSNREALCISQKKQHFYDTNIWFTWNNLNDAPLNEVTHIIHLAGANIGKGRWTSKRKKELLDSRIDTLKKLSDLCPQMPHLKQVIVASGSSFYGLFSHSHTPFTEDSHPSNKKEFFSDLARTVENKANALNLPGLTFLRMGVVLDPSGGALAKLHIPFRFKWGLAMGPGSIPLSWISLDDAVRAMDFVIEHQLTGAINLSSPVTSTYQDLNDTLNDYYNTWVRLTLPRPVVELLLGEMAQATLLKGQHCAPERLTKNGFKFEHERINDLLKK